MNCFGIGCMVDVMFFSCFLILRDKDFILEFKDDWSMILEFVFSKIVLELIILVILDNFNVEESFWFWLFKDMFVVWLNIGRELEMIVVWLFCL